MKKLLASDVDGTLFVNETIHEKSIELIKKFREQGNTFLLCTGRNFGGIKHLFDEYDIEVDGFILCNGSVVIDKNLNIIHNNLIQDKIIKEVFEEVKSSDEYNFYFADRDRLYIVNGYNEHPMISCADMKNKMEIIKIDEADFYKTIYTANIIGIDVKDECCKKAEIKKLDLENRFRDKVSIYRNESFIDIVPSDTSKGKGIAKVLSNYNVESENVFVIGDSWNDLSMFEQYNNSYTFSYAEEELKPHANNIVDNFYECINNIID